MAKQGKRDWLEPTYSEDTGCSPEDLPEAMNNREERRERIGESGTTRRRLYLLRFVVYTMWDDC